MVAVKKLLKRDSRSFLMGIGQSGTTSISVRSRNQGWFGQFGAMSITEAPSSLILHIPFHESMSALWFRKLGMCAALMERKWWSTCSRRFTAYLYRALENTPPWWFTYETTDMLLVGISVCRCSSCGRKSFRAKNTASSCNRFMCPQLWDSDHSPEAGMSRDSRFQPKLQQAHV